MSTRSIFVNEPDMTPATWALELGGTRIAAESNVQALYDIVALTKHPDGRHLSHAFMLALTFTEHQYGMDPASIEAKWDTNSWGMRRSVASPQIKASAARIIVTVRGEFVKYPVWAMSLADCCYALTAPDFVYQQEGRETIATVIARWSPNGDHDNNAERRMAAVAGMMDRLASPDAPGTTKGPTMPVPKPPIDTSHPSPNRGYRNGHGHSPIMIVDHITDGTNSLGWLTNPASGASSNYLIRRDGWIYELVPPTQSAWANGDDEQPTHPLVKEWVAKGINPNQRSISIEHECTRAQRITAAQMASSIWLQAWLCQEFKIPADAFYVNGHNEIDSVNRKYCPGWTSGEWATVLTGIRDRLGAIGGDDVKEPPEGEAQVYINGQGQTIYVWNAGGVAVKVLGSNAVDLGVSVENAKGQKYDRSIQGNVAQPWVPR